MDENPVFSSNVRPYYFPGSNISYAKERGSRYYVKIAPVGIHPVMLAIGYASMALDRSVPQLDRAYAVLTSISILASLKYVTGFNTEIGDPAKSLRLAQLCDLVKTVSNINLCEAEGSGKVSRDVIIEKLCMIAKKIDMGEIPATEQLIRVLARTVITILAPALSAVKLVSVPDQF